MKYTLKLSDVNDEFNQPWDIVLEDTKHKGVLRVQPPHPEEGANLIGFEIEPQECELTKFDPEWPTKCIGMHPVFASRSGMFSLRGYKVERVVEGNPDAREGGIDADRDN